MKKNKYNGKIARSFIGYRFGKVDMVSRFDIKNGVTFYDCYQKDGGNYIGEFRVGSLDLDQYTDDEIEIYLAVNMEIE